MVGMGIWGPQGNFHFRPLFGKSSLKMIQANYSKSFALHKNGNPSLKGLYEIRNKGLFLPPETEKAKWLVSVMAA